MVIIRICIQNKYDLDERIQKLTKTFISQSRILYPTISINIFDITTTPKAIEQISTLKRQLQKEVASVATLKRIIVFKNQNFDSFC